MSPQVGLNGCHAVATALALVVGSTLGLLAAYLRGKADEAIAVVSRFSDSASLEIHGDALMAQGKRDAAREQYQKALKTLDVAAPQRRLLETKVIDAGGSVAAEAV